MMSGFTMSTSPITPITTINYCICAEHEITGDVLLELDVTILKEELNITAFGKRMRIANGVLELRRPASFSSDPTGFQNGFPAANSPQGTPDWSGHRQEVSSNTSGDARSPGLVHAPGSQVGCFPLYINITVFRFLSCIWLT